MRRAEAAARTALDAGAFQAESETGRWQPFADIVATTATVAVAATAGRTVPAPAARPPFAPTGRELDVLRLLAAGQSNRTIADTLIDAQPAARIPRSPSTGNRQRQHGRPQGLGASRHLGEERHLCDVET